MYLIFIKIVYFATLAPLFATKIYYIKLLFFVITNHIVLFIININKFLPAKDVGEVSQYNYIHILFCQA